LEKNFAFGLALGLRRQKHHFHSNDESPFDGGFSKSHAKDEIFFVSWDNRKNISMIDILTD
jgi:hypothetical protein